MQSLPFRQHKEDTAICSASYAFRLLASKSILPYVCNTTPWELFHFCKRPPSALSIMSSVFHIASAQRPVILLVEPDCVTRSELAAQLRPRDLSVVEAVSGEEALTVLRSNRIVHVMFCPSDLDGKVTGSNLVRIVGRDFPGVKLLLNAAGPASADKLTKPFTVLLRPYRFAVVEQHLRNLLFADRTDNSK